MESFSQWLSTRMTELGVSQNELARRTGVGQTAVKGWVTGISTPSWHNCREIAAALSTDRAHVRQVAGYLDPGEEPDIDADEDAMELVAIKNELSPENRASLQLVARSLRDFQRRSVELARSR